MNTELLKAYRQARACGHSPRAALAAARRHEAALREYRAKLEAWEAEPDKRRYAAGGSANRPKYPQAFRQSDHSDHVRDGYRLVGFISERLRRLNDSPDYGYYADACFDEVYYPCVLARRMPARHEWALIPAYYSGSAGEYFFKDDGIARYSAPSAELFDDNGNIDASGYDVRHATSAADSMAERAAGESREYSERWSEASAQDSARDDARAELKAARTDATQVIAALREAGSVTPGVCAILRRNLESARHDMRDAISRIEAATARIADLDMTGEF